MGKSQETFNKKEKEKKKLKKRQDKEQKKEERKAAATKGLELEEMFAYVDENGNITATPPDPRQKKIISLEDVQIGISRQMPADPADLFRKGTVTTYNIAKGYGFIKDHDSQESVFFHLNALSGPIKENDKVAFEVEKSPKGLSARTVKLIA
jgi:cold shock CspA family protein